MIGIFRLQAPTTTEEDADEHEDPMATVRQYIDGFNKGDAKVMAATFAAPGSILDGMAPHLWQGPTATQDWYRDVLIEGKQHGASDYFVTVGEPLHNNVTGDSAYVVVPATMTFKVAGKQVTQSGAFFTVALTQARRRVAHSGLGVDERHSSVATGVLSCSNLTISSTSC